jgi:Terminase small subunit
VWVRDLSSAQSPKLPLATEPYIRARYSENGADAGACRLLRNVRIAAEVARIDAEYARAAGITALDCWKRWKVMAFTDITEFLKPGGGVKPPSEWPAGTAAAVKMYDPRGPQSSEKIRLYDQARILCEMLDRLQPVTPAVTTTVTQNVQANVDKLMLALRVPSMPSE